MAIAVRESEHPPRVRSLGTLGAIAMVVTAVYTMAIAARNDEHPARSLATHLPPSRAPPLPPPAAPAAAHTGTTPWRFHGRSTFLPSAISSARQIVARVSRGSITSSIMSLPAAM